MATVKDDLSTGLVSYWELEEASGTRVDSHGSNDLTDNNTVDQGTGKQGNCADFNSGGTGDEEYLSVSSPSGLEPLSATSISAWMNFSSVADDRQPLTIFGATGGTWAWRFILASSKMQFQLYDGSSLGTCAGTTTLSTSTWYHFVVTWNGSNSSGSRCKIYLNGSDDTASDTTPSSMQNVATSFLMGNRTGVPSGGFFQGLIDEVGIWNTELTSGNVTTLYNGGDGIPYENATASTFIPKVIVF